MSRTVNVKKLTAFAALGLLLTSGLLYAGPLNPPAGPIGSTYKTLTEVEPRIAISATNTPSAAGALRRITQPGSYYLTGNLEVFNVESGIVIQLNTEGLVTIDLNGFSIIGRGDLTVSGIDVVGPFTPRVVVKNGFVTQFQSHGVDLTGTESVTIENVESTRNGGKGFVAGKATLSRCKAQFNSAGGVTVGDNSALDHCEALNNGQDGIATGHSCRVSECTAKSNTAEGIDCAYFSTLSSCVASNNTGYGINTDLHCSVTACVANNNGEAGIGTNQGCTVTTCSAANNTKWGFSTGGNSVYTACVGNDNGFSGFTGLFCHYTQCTANQNSFAGFSVGGASVVENCSAQGNHTTGIEAGGACMVIGNRIEYNDGDGISLSLDNNIIKGNMCISNGGGLGASQDGANIHTAGAGNRIEDNECIGADRGIHVTGVRSIITGNSCSGNTTNWVIGVNNFYGPIVDRSAAATAAVNGNSAASTLASTDPKANYTK